ncbi:MAG: hypothetical protein KDN22_26815 [Verrucomicrobiae bacterium]|nr:hypothetical protein [Verrucomicrobiae bacterium]
MFNLESSINRWRVETMQGDAIDHLSLRELESHLREMIDTQVAQGDSPEAAFAFATIHLGEGAHLNVEFRKVHTNVPWQRRLFAIITGFTALSCAVYLVSILSTLAKMLLWRVGLTQDISLPWAQPNPWAIFEPDRNATIEHVSAVTVGSYVVWIALMLALVALCHRALSGRLAWISNLVERCQKSDRRLIAAIICLGIGHALVSIVVPAILRHSIPDAAAAGYRDFALGEFALHRLTFWINPLVHILLGVITLRAWRKIRGSGIFDPVATGIAGYVMISTGFVILSEARVGVGLTTGRYFGSSEWNHLQIGVAAIEVLVALALITLFLFAIISRCFSSRKRTPLSTSLPVLACASGIVIYVGQYSLHRVLNGSLTMSGSLPVTAAILTLFLTAAMLFLGRDGHHSQIRETDNDMIR